MTQEIPDQAIDREQRRERLVLFILAAVQFTTIVDFMIVMPLGPQLMRTLHIGPTKFGLIVSSYTFAAGVAGLVASSIVARFARRTTFVVLYAGFLLGTFRAQLPHAGSRPHHDRRLRRHRRRNVDGHHWRRLS
jgi:MFS transporter, DHA1 family, inner membrane transport protein